MKMTIVDKDEGIFLKLFAFGCVQTALVAINMVATVAALSDGRWALAFVHFVFILWFSYALRDIYKDLRELDFLVQLKDLTNKEVLDEREYGLYTRLIVRLVELDPKMYSNLLPSKEEAKKDVGSES